MDNSIVDDSIERAKSLVRTIPDFPKPGIMFRDITTLLRDKWGFHFIADHLAKRYAAKHIDIVVGIESRGFIIGAAVAALLGCGFVPVRKLGKLPWDVMIERYTLEYGKDHVEIHKDAIKPGERIVIIDDLIATGGTALAAAALCERLEAEIVECAFVVGLPALKGKARMDKYPWYVMMEFEGE